MMVGKRPAHPPPNGPGMSGPIDRGETSPCSLVNPAGHARLLVVIQSHDGTVPWRNCPRCGRGGKIGLLAAQSREQIAGKPFRHNAKSDKSTGALVGPAAVLAFR